MDHHSRAIVDILPNMINRDLPHLKQYLDSRLCETTQSKRHKRGMIREKPAKGIVASNFWFGEDTLNELF